MTHSAGLDPGIAPGNPVLAEVIRSGFTESRHRGAIAVVYRAGGLARRAAPAVLGGGRVVGEIRASLPF